MPKAPRYPTKRALYQPDPASGSVCASFPQPQRDPETLDDLSDARRGSEASMPHQPHPEPSQDPVTLSLLLDFRSLSTEATPATRPGQAWEAVGGSTVPFNIGSAICRPRPEEYGRSCRGADERGAGSVKWPKTQPVHFLVPRLFESRSSNPHEAFARYSPHYRNDAANVAKWLPPYDVLNISPTALAPTQPVGPPSHLDELTARGKSTVLSLSSRVVSDLSVSVSNDRAPMPPKEEYPTHVTSIHESMLVSGLFSVNKAECISARKRVEDHIANVCSTEGGSLDCIKFEASWVNIWYRSLSRIGATKFRIRHATSKSKRQWDKDLARAAKRKAAQQGHAVMGPAVTCRLRRPRTAHPRSASDELTEQMRHVIVELENLQIECRENGD
ncbi:unnamed protein product [Cutaneotrichosporon oleaginosum]